MSVPAIRAVAFLSVVAAPVVAQIPSGAFEVRYTFDGASDPDHVGFSVAGAGDVNGDGFDDVIVGGPQVNPGGSASVYSGKDGVLLWRFDGAGSDDRFGWSVDGAGDVNDDGFPDLIVGARWADPGGIRDAGSAYVFSGKDGTLLWQFDGSLEHGWMGWAVDGAGDVNQDGFDDVIVSAMGHSDPSIQPRSSVYVFSGKDGATLWLFDDSADPDLRRFGSSVDGAGDVNQDGFNDIIIGDESAATGGSAFVYSGKDGTLIWRFDGSELGDRMGGSVAAAGDVNRDGFPDVIVGSHWAEPEGLDDAGSVFVYSGRDGSLIWRFDGAFRDWLGVSVAGVGDVNQDGFPDIMAGAFAAGYARVFSGQDGRILWQIDGAPDDGVGFAVAGAGDVNGDGFPDIIEGAHLRNGDSGGAHVLVYEPALFSYGTGIEGSGNAVPKIGSGGEIPQVGNPTFQVQVTETLGGAPCVIAGSLVRAEQQLFGGTVYADIFTPGAFVFFGFISTGPAGFPGVGTAAVPISVPNEPTLIGFTTYWQAFVVDPGSPLAIGISHTGGLSVTVIQ